MRKLCLALLLCIMLLPLPGQAAAPYSFDAATGTLTAWADAAGAVEIPAQIDGAPVRTLGDALFNQNQQITQVTVPQGVLRLNQSAFYACEGLTSLALPDGLQVIGGYALFLCSGLTELTLPASLSVIGDRAFSGMTGLTRLTILGAPPEHIGADAFTLAQDVPQVVVTVPAEHEAAWETLLGVDCQPGPAAPPRNLVAAESELSFDPATGTLLGYTGVSAAVQLPQQVGGVPLRAIGAKALFANPYLCYLAVPGGVETIGKEALAYGKLYGLTLPDSLHTLGEDAIRGNTTLSKLRLGTGLRQMGKGALSGNALTSVTLPEGLTALPELALENNIWLEDAYLPSTLAEIGPGAFKNCSSLAYLVVNRAQLPAIAADAFEGTKLADVDIAATATKAQEDAARDALAARGIQTNVWRANEADQAPYPGGSDFAFQDGLITGYTGTATQVSSFWNYWQGDVLAQVTGVADGALRGSAITRFDLPRSNDFVSIGKVAFADSQLTEIRLFDSLTTIGEGAFRNCVNLQKVLIPDSVTSIGAGAFAGCTNLQEVVLPASAAIAPDAFAGLNPAILWGSPTATDQQLANTGRLLKAPWYEGLRRPGEPSRLKPLPEGYAANAESDFEFDATAGHITRYIGQTADVVIPRAIGGVPVTGIGVTAFSDLTVLTVATGQQDNTGLRSVVIPDTVRTIGDSAFLNCKALERVECWGPIDLLGIRAFEQCSSLKEVVFHNGIYQIGGYAFNLCASLQQAQLGDRVALIDEGAFAGCTALEQFSLPASIEKLGGYVFQNADGLRSLCYPRADTALLTEGSLPMNASDLRIYLPQDTPDDQVSAFNTAVNGVLMRFADIVQKGGCPAGDEAAQPASAAVELPAQAEAPTEAPAQVSAPEPAAADGVVDRMFVCTKAESSGVTIDVAVIGRYDVRFGADGQAAITIGGTALPPCPYVDDGTALTVDYYGTSYVFKRVEGGLSLDYMGAMQLFFQPE